MGFKDKKGIEKAIFPIGGGGVAGGSVAAGANADITPALGGFAASKVQVGYEIIGSGGEGVALYKRLKARHSRSQQYGGDGQGDHQLDEGKASKGFHGVGLRSA